MKFLGGRFLKKYLILFIAVLGIWSCGKEEKTADKSSGGNAETCAVSTGETKTEDVKVTVPKGEEITVDGKEVTILNKRIKVGDKLEDAELISPVGEFNKMQKVKLSNDKGIKVIYTAPSLDTPVCSLQTKTLDSKAKEHSNVFFYSITNDLPFAMTRFCSDNEIHNLKTLSDYQGHEFSSKNGFLMKEYQLLTRAIIIVDENDIVKYVDYGKEVTKELDIDKAMNFLENDLLKK